MASRGRNYKSVYEFYNRTEPAIQSVANMGGPSSATPLDMRWERKKVPNLVDPSVWGPAFWFTLHNGAANYPDYPNNSTQERMKGFIIGIPAILPCEKCREHATQYINANYNNLNSICSTRENLFNFFVDFHNYVNNRYNKPMMSYDDAHRMFASGAVISRLTFG
jgi:FAD-linked sulfhydryl oxidase